MKKVYTIRDNVANRIGPLVVFATDAEAKRAVTHALVTGSDDIMKRSPADFVLLFLCEVDVSTGELRFADYPSVVCGVHELVPQE